MFIEVGKQVTVDELLDGVVIQSGNDPNMTCQTLLDTILQRPTDTPLPEVLYLQLDNTTSQNKCVVLLFFCALLVALGIFAKIKVSFLPVGHT